MKIFLSIISATALALTLARAEPPAAQTTTTTTTTTENVGTITEFTPGANIVLSTGAGEPVHYKFGKNVTFVNGRGKVINASKFKKDRKVRVHYVKEGNDMVVDKVTIVKD
ncbi:MAG: hypothetical protein ABJB69_09930 [Spartobacteria bacterium]